MVQVSLTQIIVVVVFLAALIAVKIVLQRNARGIGKRLGRGREIQVVEVTVLGPNDRLSLVEVDGQRILVLTGRHGVGAFMVLGPATQENTVEAP